MKKIILMGIFLIIPMVAKAEIILQNDSARRQISAFIPVPGRSLVPITGTYVFQHGTGGNTDMTNWSIISIRPTAASTYYYNEDTTKVKTIDADVDNLVFVGQAGVVKVTFVLGEATAQIQAR